MRRYGVLITLAVVIAAGAAAALLYDEYVESSISDAEASAREDVLAELDDALKAQQEAIEAASRRFESVDDLKTDQELRLRRYRNADHLERARQLGVGRVSGLEEIERLVAQDRLVRLEDTTEYYYLQEFDYSVPYVTPDAARLLNLIGERLHDELRAHGLPLYRFNISSVLRTAENQRDLRRINPNATFGVSTHEFGTTLDVVVHIYDYVPRPEDVTASTPYASLNERLKVLNIRQFEALGMRYWRHLKGILGRILIDLQDEGLVMVTLERQQPVFHMTVAQRIAEGS